jgi:hypothetical protein
MSHCSARFDAARVALLSFADARVFWSPLPVIRERVRVRVISGCRAPLVLENHPHPCPLPASRERETEPGASVAAHWPRHNTHAQLPPVMPALRSTADGRQHRHRSPDPLSGLRDTRARSVRGAAAGLSRRRLTATTRASSAKHNRRSGFDSVAIGSSMATDRRGRLRGCDRRGRDIRPLSPGCSTAIATATGRVGATRGTGNDAGRDANHTDDSPGCRRDPADRKCHPHIANHGARDNRTGSTNRAGGGARRGRRHD